MSFGPPHGCAGEQIPSLLPGPVADQIASVAALTYLAEIVCSGSLACQAHRLCPHSLVPPHCSPRKQNLIWSPVGYLEVGEKANQDHQPWLLIEQAGPSKERERCRVQGFLRNRGC
jgi:hypothetical protein